MPDETPESDLPPSLKRELASMYRREVAVPRGLDEAIVSEARHRIRARRPRLLLLRMVGAGAAVAATLALAVHLFNSSGKPLEPVGVAQVVNLHDLNRDGRVDILDALYLAQHLNNPKPPAAWDVNGDGKLDQADVDALAAEVVRVGGLQ